MPRYLPKSIVCLRQSYSRQTFLGDLVAGITVGVIALPLAMAFGIASIPESVAAEAGISPPAAGLYTAIVAGFLISALGGSRVQIGGPTGAFIVVVYAVAAEYGYSGLVTATLMAGVMVALMGILRLGAVIKFIPFPVVTGLTTGIAVLILATQVKDFFGLRMAEVPAEFFEKLGAYLRDAHTWNPTATSVSVVSLIGLLVLRSFVPRLPGPILVIVAASCLVSLLGLEVETIGSRFGGIPRSLPVPHLPDLSFSLARTLIPAAATIAVLAAIESLLSAVVADGMIGGRHKADCELVAQGVANVASAVFGGIPATGALARTAANVKSGGRTPVAGIIHAVTLVAIMALLAPLASAIPLPALAAVLVMVAWNMSELRHFRGLLRAPRCDVGVLLVTLGLTIAADLTVAVGVGLVLASLLFMKQMADVSNIRSITAEFDNGDDSAELRDPNSIQTRHVPPGVEVYEINGPLFFGVADRVKSLLQRIERPAKVFILRLRHVPTIDATGLHSLEDLHENCRREGTTLLLSGVHAQPLNVLIRSGLYDTIGSDKVFGNIDQALAEARRMLGLPPSDPPPEASAEVTRDQRMKAG